MCFSWVTVLLARLWWLCPRCRLVVERGCVFDVVWLWNVAMSALSGCGCCWRGSVLVHHSNPSVWLLCLFLLVCFVSIVFLHACVSIIQAFAQHDFQLVFQRAAMAARVPIDALARDHTYSQTELMPRRSTACMPSNLTRRATVPENGILADSRTRRPCQQIVIRE
jgi:hypothetical protein